MKNMIDLGSGPGTVRPDGDLVTLEFGNGILVKFRPENARRLAEALLQMAQFVEKRREKREKHGNAS